MEVKLSDIGEGMTEATLNCFFVKPGDFVKADQPLVEVQTDKMTAEIPAPTSGIVKELKVAAGENILVGTTLLILEKDKTETLKTTVSVVHSSNVKGRVMASPYTRKIARENRVMIEEVVGTGPSGRITDEDVYRFLEQQSLPEQKQKIEPPNKEVDFIKEIYVPTDEESQQDMIPFRGRRKQIAKKMVQSLQTIAHCTHFEEIDVSALLEFRNELKNNNRNMTVTAFFLKALSLCLKEFPIFNANLNEEQEAIYLKKEHHIGVAVDTKEGLIVPVMRHVERKSISQLHQEIKLMTEKALQDQLTVKEITGGTFTISNVGPLGGSIGATPIIQHPEVALVSFHKTKKRPVVTDDDQIVIRSMMNVSMSFDHRVADGAMAVAFTNRLAEFIENPKLMILELV
ncbi:dihydrolipoamide acetyltransferase family protein [Neobacillus sp. D3-1R]|uniref:dihydrolipoamide acetyltransferase family protein n=1 Tax=Neobacillus sp. D3-1R TaxID=3445778 RepID=UPI003FA0246C